MEPDVRVSLDGVHPADGQESCLAGRRVAVVGDSDLVCRVVKMALRSRLKLDVGSMEACDLVPGEGASAPAWDLVVVAVTSSGGEPVVELSRSSLLECAGRIPLLIISTRPGESAPELLIFHLRFPFDMEQLCNRVRLLLQDGTRTARRQAVP